MSEDNPTRSPTRTDQMKEGGEQGVKVALDTFKTLFVEARAYQILKTSNGWQSAEETEDKIQAFSHLEHALIEEDGSICCEWCNYRAPSIFVAEIDDEMVCVWCNDPDSVKTEASE